MSKSGYLINKEIFKDKPGYPAVDNYDLLPEPDSVPGATYSVTTSITGHPSGFYYSNAGSWYYLVSGGGSPVTGGNLGAQDGLKITNGTGAVLINDVYVGTDSDHVIPTTIEQSAWNQAVSDITEINSLAAERNSTGLISGGIITPSGISPIGFDVSSGVGYIVNHITSKSKRVVWLEQHNIETIGDGVNYFCIDTYGIVNVFLTVPDKNLYLYLGAAVATQNNTVVISVQKNPSWVGDFQDRVTEFASASIRTVIESGCEVSEQLLNPLKIHVNNGWINTRLDRIEITPNDTLIKVFATSNYGFVPDSTNIYSPADTINTIHWNDITKPYGQSMIEMTEGYWKKDLIAIFPNSEIFYVYGQNEYLTESLAKQAPMQSISSTISTAAIYLAFIISRKGDTSVKERIIDLRPNFNRIWGLLGSNIDSKPANPSINLMSTGLLNGGMLSINADITKFDLSRGNALIVDNSDILNPIYKTINWENKTAITDPLLSTCDTTYVRINSEGVLSFHEETCTNEERRDYVEIGWLDHPSRTKIDFAKTEPFYNASIQSQLNDFIENFGPFNISGNEYSPATGLQIQRSAGKLFDGNSNYSNNIKDPHVINTEIENPCDIYYYYRDTSTGWVNDSAIVNVIDPNHYDDNSGTLANVPTDKWTIQVITYYSIYEANDIQYGQVVYDTYTDALAAIYSYIELNPYNADDVFRCWLIVKQGATDLSNIDQAVFHNTKGRLRLNEIIQSSASTNNLNVDTIQFNTTLDNPAFVEGKVFYDKTKHALSYYNERADVTLNIGQENIIRVKNETGVKILNGSVVYPSGVSDGSVTIGLATARDKDKCRLIGVVTHDIENGDYGYVTKFGEVGGLNTSTFTGGVVYLSDTPGQLTQTKPTGGSYITQIGAVKSIGTSTGSVVVDINTTEMSVEAVQTVGFSPTNLCTISFVDTNANPLLSRTLHLTAVSGEYDFYQYGDKYSKSADSIQITDEEGLYVIYYNLGTLAYVKNPIDSQIDDLIRNYPLVAYVYWNASDKKNEYIGYELHKIGMNSNTHAYLHFVLRCRYMGGLALNSIISDASGDLATSAQFGVDAGGVVDEDLYFPTASINFNAGLPIAYLSGTLTTPTLRVTSNSGFSILTTGTGRMAYNTLSGSNYVLSEVSNNNFACCHVIAINENNINKRVVAFVGQVAYTTVSNARAGAQTEIQGLRTIGIIPQEAKAIATLVFQTSDGYANAVKSRIRSISTGVDYVDWRNVQVAGSAGGGGTVLSTSFNDSLFQLYNNVDSTKVLKFSAANVTTNTTRTLSAPNADGTIIISEGVDGSQTIKGGVTSTGYITLYNNSIDNQGVTVEGDGTLSTNVTSYEALVLNDNDIPNRKFVTDYAMAKRDLWYTAGAFELPSITETSTGSVILGSGKYNFYTDWGNTSDIVQVTIPGATYALTNNTLNYIVGDYNNGSPIIRVTTNPAEIADIFNNPVVPIFSIYREDNNLNVVDWDEPGNGLAEKLLVKDASLGRFDWQMGLALSESATRVVNISSGLVWHGVNRQTLSTFKSDVVDNTFSLYYHTSTGSWTKTTITQYTNSQYDDGTSLQNLTTGEFVVVWVYRSVEAHTHASCVYSNKYASLALAQASQPPSSLPGIATASTIFVGRIIVEYNASSATQIDSAFSTAFSASAVSSHSDLTNRDVAGNHTLLIPLVDSTTAVRIMKADGTTPVLTADTTNNKVIVEDINIDNLTASTAVVTDSNKNLISSSTTATELSYVHGVTSDIQSQLSGKEPANANIQSHIGIVAGNPHGTTKSDLGLSNVDNTSDANKPISTAQQNIYNVIKDPTGFRNPELVVVTYSQTNRTFSLTGTVEAYYNGVLVAALTNTFVSDPHPVGKTVSQWLYYNGTFNWADSFPGFDVILIGVAIYHGASIGFRAVRECHGVMPWQTHRNEHLAVGAVLYSGGASSGVTLASTTAALRRPDISETVLLDEDLLSTVPALTSKLYSHHYLSGTSTVPVSNITLSNADIIPLSTNRPYYNQLNGTTWQQTLLSTNGYTSVYVIALPAAADAESQAVRYLFCQGQKQDVGGNTAQNATALANQLALDPATLNTYSLSQLSPEWRIIWQYVIKYNGTNWTIEGEQQIAGTKSRPVSITGVSGLTTVTTDTSLSGTGTVLNPLAVVYEDTSTEIQMNGVQSSGNNITAARGDHVHPVDTSREPANANIQTHIGLTSSNPHGVSDVTLSMSNVTNNNVSITQHGFVPKAPNDIAQFLSGDGTWRQPAGSVSYKEFTFVLHRGENATIGNNKTNALIVSSAMTIVECFAYAKIGPTGTSFICDINKNGTTIWATQINRITINAGSVSGNQINFDTTTLAKNDILTIDIDQIGSVIAGSDITIVLKCTI